jgi:hypothetical protein
MNCREKKLILEKSDSIYVSLYTLMVVAEHKHKNRAHKEEKLFATMSEVI